VAFWNRRKQLDGITSGISHSALKPTLSWSHLIGLGVGGIVGTGIVVYLLYARHKSALTAAAT